MSPLQPEPQIPKQTILRQTNGGVTPLSFGQQRMWFLQQLDPTSPVYNTYQTWRVRSALNVAALRKAFETIVARHEVLRAIIQVIDGKPCQITNEEWTYEFPCIDLREYSSEAPEDVAREITRQEAKTPFDLSRGPLFRAKLLRLDDEDHVLLVSMHHIISDGWSFGVLHREIRVLYQAFESGGSSPLPALPLQYGDYALWQHDFIQGTRLEKLLKYWSRQLSHLTPLELPTDRIRPSMPTLKGGRQRFSIGKVLTARLKGWYQEEGVTLFTTLLTCFKVLLFRYSGQADIAVGTAIHSRMYKEIEPLIGMFVNTLVLRSDLSGNPSFRELLQRVRNTCKDAFANQELPFDKLVDVLQPERDMSRNPLFQAAIVFQNTPDQLLELPGLAVSPFESSSTGPSQLGNDTSKFDLTLTLRESDGEIQGMMEYSTDLFDSTTIRRMVAHFQALIEGVVEDPAQRLSRISLLDEVERQQLLVEWNATETVYPREATIAERFEAQVAATPDAVALVFGEQQLTYGQLNTRANHLAQYLYQHYGVGPEVCVGLCVERSFEMVVGLLGILKAGAAYVPIDPGTPPERVAFMLKDADIALVLTQDALKADLPTEWTEPVIALDTEWAAIAQTPATNVMSGVTAENLAYIMYTSGSTGVPKGTSICQRNVVRLVTNTNYLDFGAAETVLQFAPLAFDASTLELWGSLLHGAKLVIFSPHQPSLEELGHCLQEHEISTLWLTAALFHQMVGSQLDALRGVRQLLAGGDVLSVPHVQRVLANLPEGGRLINGYGPTENTTFTCCHVMTRESLVVTAVPIGRPIANTQVYVLDRAMQPVPVGVYGELHIGGDGLARNYLQRPKLTAEKFVPDPFSEDPGARLYKTGDRVRYHPDGTLEFLGRVDHQVKLRGYRIELGEIEAVLSQHPAVQEMVTLVREDRPGDPRLVAYVVVALKEEPSMSEFRSFLQKKLPDYMIPAVFIKMDALPLTPNGKVDRKALPAPEGSRTQLETAFVAPQTPTEEQLAEIWQEVLGVEQVGIQDNFFELGGHSLLATQVISRVRALFHIEVPLRHMFEGPTIDRLAKFIENTRRAGQMLTAPLAPCSRADTLPLSFAQQRLWFLEQFEPGSTAYSMPSSFRLRGVLDLPALEWSLNELVKRHESLRTIFAQDAGEPIQVILPSLQLPVPLIDLQSLPEAEREPEMRRLCSREAQTPFELAVGPLIRAQVIRMGTDDHVVLMTLHHIISDGWSMGVLFKELEICYQAYSEGREPILPPLPVQYADYAVWQREYLQGERLEKEVDYWRKYLHAPLPTLRLPTDAPRPSMQSHRGARESLLLSSELKADLLAFGQQRSATLFMTLLAIFQSLVHRWSGQDDVCVGIPSAGRTRLETEGLIGFFINTLVVRTTLTEDCTYHDLLMQVRAGALGAYAHQTIPFEKLVEVLQPTRDLSRTPVFQIFFNMVPSGIHPFSLSGLSVERMSHQEEPESKFDLTLYVQEEAAGIHLNLVYNADLFRPERIQAYLHQFRTVAEQVAQSPYEPLAGYSLQTQQGQAGIPDPTQPLCQTWVGSMVTRVSRQAQAHPKASAVRYRGVAFTYQELEERSNQLAHAILTKGIQSPKVVAVFGHKSVPLVVTLLGILKAGAAFLILDPRYPEARILAMMRAVSPQGFIHLEEAGDLPDGVRASLTTIPWHLNLSSSFGGLIDYSKIAPDVDIQPDDMAYIAFTSGTSGRPKGIIGNHRPLSHFFDWYQREFSLTANDRFSLLSGLAHDPLIRDIFAPLWVGGTLVIPEFEVFETESLGKWVEAEGITVAHLTPVMEQILSRGRADNCPSWPALRYLVFGGDRLQTAQVVRLQERAPQVTIVNFYGATETPQAMAYYVISERAIPSSEWLPIGKGIADVQVLIINKGGQLAGIGEQGEICVRTPYLTQGYLHDEHLTQAKFIPNLFGARDANDYMYRTGDLGRYRPDGHVEILGRLDEQVKIRGVRIEPDEVMHALSTHPSVHACFVMAREDNTDSPALVAYVVPTVDTAPTAFELRTYVAGQLPAAMIPSTYVFLEVLPYTPNGKIDRQALPLPDGEREKREVAFVAPRTPIEVAIAAIWQEVLKLDRVGIQDNFFDLGGHSLLATQVVARVRDSLHIDLKLRHLFEVPTLKELAGTVEILQNSTQSHESFTDNTGEDRSEIVL